MKEHKVLYIPTLILRGLIIALFYWASDSFISAVIGTILASELTLAMQLKENKNEDV